MASCFLAATHFTEECAIPFAVGMPQTKGKRVIMQLGGKKKKVIHRDSIPPPAIGVQISIKEIRIQAVWGGKAGIYLLLRMCHCAEEIQDLFNQKELTRASVML